MKAGVEPTPETSCISSVPQTVDNAQYSFPMDVINFVGRTLNFETNKFPLVKKVR
jgi:hypothetical protein